MLSGVLEAECQAQVSLARARWAAARSMNCSSRGIRTRGLALPRQARSPFLVFEALPAVLLDMPAQCSAGTLLNKSRPRNQLKPLMASDF